MVSSQERNTHMAIPESQLETWSHQGAIATSRNTYASIKGALEAWNTTYADKDFEIFLQGSYGNDTNIYADSDVDIVIMLKSVFRSDRSLLPQTNSCSKTRHTRPQLINSVSSRTAWSASSETFTVIGTFTKAARP
jgi:hypothetical protein